MVAASMQNAYAGDISVHDAWRMLQENPHTILVDVRTPEEWQQIGTTDLTQVKKEAILLSWRTLPGMRLNPVFEMELAAKFPGTDTPILFLCKAGGRSQEAAIAMTHHGYTHCYNITGGFEFGWKPNQLPCRN